jgi:hypothetical protein
MELIAALEKAERKAALSVARLARDDTFQKGDYKTAHSLLVWEHEHSDLTETSEYKAQASLFLEYNAWLAVKAGDHKTAWEFMKYGWDNNFKFPFYDSENCRKSDLLFVPMRELALQEEDQESFKEYNHWLHEGARGMQEYDCMEYENKFSRVLLKNGDYIKAKYDTSNVMYELMCDIPSPSYKSMEDILNGIPDIESYDKSPIPKKWSELVGQCQDILKQCFHAAIKNKDYKTAYEFLRSVEKYDYGMEDLSALMDMAEEASDAEYVLKFYNYISYREDEHKQSYHLAIHDHISVEQREKMSHYLSSKFHIVRDNSSEKLREMHMYDLQTKLELLQVPEHITKHAVHSLENYF